MALLSGTVVVVSGVGPGLGRSIALASAREGADLETWAYGLDRFTEARGRHDPAQFYDVEYDDFVAKPLGTVAAVYQHFGLTLSGRAADAMRALCEQSPGTAGSGHRHALSDFGLTAEQVDERFGGYHRARA